jgi:transposase-like protein
MTLSIDLSDEDLEKILRGDRGMDLLMEKAFHLILDAEMTEYLAVDRYERSENRTGYRNGSYECRLTLEVSRCKDGSFSTELFGRYQRSEKALVSTLMEITPLAQGQVL